MDKFIKILEILGGVLILLLLPILIALIWWDTTLILKLFGTDIIIIIFIKLISNTYNDI